MVPTSVILYESIIAGVCGGTAYAAAEFTADQCTQLYAKVMRTIWNKAVNKEGNKPYPSQELIPFEVTIVDSKVEQRKNNSCQEIAFKHITEFQIKFEEN